jgi:phosphatidate cytidylyltransferase
MLIVRLATAAILIPILLAVLWAGGLVLTATIALITLVAGAEAGSLLRRAGFPVWPPLVAALAALAVVEAATAPLETFWALPAWIVVVVGAGAVAGVARSDTRQGLLAWAGTVLAALYTGMLAFLLRIPVLAGTAAAEGRLVEALDAGRVWLLILVLGVWAYDTAAYAVGRAWGRGHFFPRISPHKTWSGTAGGTIAAIIAGGVLGALVGRPAEGAGLGVLIAVAAPLGDLAESVLKRAAGVKDSGQLIPGHGGMLDRVDSLLIAAPLAWIYLDGVGII